MSKYFLLMAMLLFSPMIIWSQTPKEQPMEEWSFAWLDDPMDEGDFDFEAAEPPAPPFNCGLGMIGEGRWAEKLNLTDEQKKTLREMRLKHQKEMIPLRGDLKSKHLDLQSAMQADKPDQTKINALVDQIAKVKADIQKKTIAFRLEMRKQLTPEQLKMWDENRGRAFRKFMHDRRGFRGPGREDRPFHGPF